jgi:hypothetical protein
MLPWREIDPATVVPSANVLQVGKEALQFSGRLELPAAMAALILEILADHRAASGAR